MVAYLSIELMIAKSQFHRRSSSRLKVSMKLAPDAGLGFLMGIASVIPTRCDREVMTYLKTSPVKNARRALYVERDEALDGCFVSVASARSTLSVA